MRPPHQDSRALPQAREPRHTVPAAAAARPLLVPALLRDLVALQLALAGGQARRAPPRYAAAQGWRHAAAPS